MKLFPKVYVLHHKDMDGYFAAAAHLQRFKPNIDSGEMTVEYIPVVYNKPIPEIPDGEDVQVIIVDFSYSREILIDLQSRVGNLLVIDHHATAERQLQGLDFCVFDMTKSGNILSWDYFNPGIDPPTVHVLAQDYDLYTKLFKDSEYLEAGIQASGHWNDLMFYFELQNNPDKVAETINVGKIIYTHEYNQCEYVLKGKQFKVIDFFGIKTALVNWTGNPNMLSEVIYNTGEVQAVLSYKVRINGNYKFSFRAPKNSGLGLDLIAEKFGGGGHESSAGFEINEEVSYELLRRLYAETSSFGNAQQT